MVTCELTESPGFIADCATMGPGDFESLSGAALVEVDVVVVLDDVVLVVVVVFFPAAITVVEEVGATGTDALASGALAAI